MNILFKVEKENCMIFDMSMRRLKCYFLIPIQKNVKKDFYIFFLFSVVQLKFILKNRKTFIVSIFTLSIRKKKKPVSKRASCKLYTKILFKGF